MRLTVRAGNATLRALVRIDGIVNGKVYLSAKKMVFPAGTHYSTEFTLDNCHFDYRNAGNASETLDGVPLGCDAVLYVYHFDATTTLRTEISLAVLPIPEWTQF